MNQDERRAFKIVNDKITTNRETWQKFLNSEYRKGLGNKKPNELVLAFANWLDMEAKRLREQAFGETKQ
jgi:hypothetical protein